MWFWTRVKRWLHISIDPQWSYVTLRLQRLLNIAQVLRLYKPLVWEYSRLNITHTVMSKRKLKALVEGAHVRGWDDPRLPTLAAMRRRGYTPQVPRAAFDTVLATQSSRVPLAH